MTRPNFLILQADQLTSQVLGAYGRTLAKTPHIDRLASEGVVFRNSYCSYPLCGPSRMSMMTGRLASRVGCYDNATALSSEIPTFAHYLRVLGYRTTLSGKMHFVGADQLHGFEERLTSDIYPGDFSFTESATVKEVKGRSDARGVTLAGICDASVQLDHDELVMFRAKQHLLDMARDNDTRPFCLLVSITHPHEPFYCLQKHWDRYTDEEIAMPDVGRLPSQASDPLTQFITERWQLDRDFDDSTIRRARRAYLGLVSYVDDKLAELQSTLARSGFADNTIIVFLGDHGEMLGERGMWFKRHFYEWSARVPMIWHAPKRFAPATRSENVSLMDLLPTLMALGADGSLQHLVEPIEGRSLLPLLRGSPVIWDNVAYAETMSDGLAAPVFMIRRDDWKLIWGPQHPAQLFNLDDDPLELTNVAGHAGPGRDVLGGLLAEAEKVWNAAAIQAGIELSTERRILIRTAHRTGKPPVWDYEAPSLEAGRWFRDGDDYGRWSFGVLNPR